MSSPAISHPESSEYAPYYDKYISLIKGDDILLTLNNQLSATTDLLNSISEDKANFRYGPDKWSIKELIGHIIDTERIMAYRALRIARNDKTPIEGFEQDDYVKNGPFGDCKLKDLVGEFRHVREANIDLFQKLSPEAWLRTGTANNNVISTRALAFIIAGHELHHMGILKTKYL
jgi:hypothetical protein